MALKSAIPMVYMSEIGATSVGDVHVPRGRVKFNRPGGRDTMSWWWFRRMGKLPIADKLNPFGHGHS